MYSNMDMSGVDIPKKYVIIKEMYLCYKELSICREEKFSMMNYINEVKRFENSFRLHSSRRNLYSQETLVKGANQLRGWLCE